MPHGAAVVTKRYRPAPAKTFQCRGYGECRMVFSRSEHLARHIRKHTGERPFTCHCGKQFSRLDNLRQHAQTVHADKQDQNERMMRDLTSLHATMAAANKANQPRGGRRANITVPAREDAPMVKQEDVPVSMRPGTSTGYEGDHSSIMTSWHVQSPDSSHSFRDSSHSFREPGQSFLASSTSSTASGQSFLPVTTELGSLGVTSRGSGQSLPPLSAVVSSSVTIHSSSPEQPSGQSQSTQSSSSVLPFPTLRPISTAGLRPGTAPALSSSTSFFSKPAYFGTGLGSRLTSDLSSGYGRTDMGDSDVPQSPAGYYDSPFSFHPPPAATVSNPAESNPRKRAFGGPNGPDDDGKVESANASYEYEYGSESRPQSRRLSVLELCNDGEPGPVLATGTSRPNTSSGLVSGAQALALVDREYTSPHSGSSRFSPSPTTSPGSALRSRTAAPSAGSDEKGTAGGGDPTTEGGRGIFGPARRFPSTELDGATDGRLLSTATATYSLAVSGSPTSASSSPRSSPASPAAYPASSFASRSPVSDGPTAGYVPRAARDNQVRGGYSEHVAVGMRL